MSELLPKWPERFYAKGMNLQQCTESWLEYERARVDAAMARLRVAVAKLKEAREDIDNWAGYASEYFVEKHDLAGCLRSYEETLASIGELPPE